MDQYPIKISSINSKNYRFYKCSKLEVFPIFAFAPCSFLLRFWRSFLLAGHPRALELRLQSRPPRVLLRPGRHRLRQGRVEAEGNGKAGKVSGGEAKFFDQREPEQRPRVTLQRRGGDVRASVGLADHRTQRSLAGHGQRVRVPWNLHGKGIYINANTFMSFVSPEEFAVYCNDFGKRSNPHSLQ